MERKIGEIFEYNGEWYQCVNTGFSCADCDIKGDCSSTYIGACSPRLRKDGKQVRFKKLEKVGEPFSKYVFPRGNVLVQRYKLHIQCDTNVSNGYWIYHWNEKLVDIEIKQNKEDMEENNNAKHSNSENIGKNLKPFDLQAAKSGKPVCTRDGRKARIICFDMNADKPIVALVDYNGRECVVYCNNEGRACLVETTYDDLMMLSEKKEGWVNIYKDPVGKVLSTQIVFSSEETAKQNISSNRIYISTVKIEWYE